jgi:lipopolysaccharide export system permease protein
MRILERYILRQLIVVTLVVTVGLTFTVWLSQSLRLMKLIVNQGLDIGTFLYLIGLLAPSFLLLVLPIAAFCAVMVIYNKAVVDSEMVVMRSAGISSWQMARPALILGFLVTLACFAVSFYLLPASYRDFKDIQVQLRSELGSILIEEGVFNEVTEGVTVYVRSRNDDGTLEGILVHDNRDPAKPVTMMAERGAIADTAGVPKVVMASGNRQEMDRASGKLSLLHFDRYTLVVDRLTNQGPARWREPRERYFHELVGPPIHVLDQQKRDELIGEAHRRIAQPLLGFTLVLVALAFLLSGEFNRRGQGKRILVGTMTVAAIEGLAFGASSAVDDSLSFAPALYVVSILPGAVACWVLSGRGLFRLTPGASKQAQASRGASA